MNLNKYKPQSGLKLYGLGFILSMLGVLFFIVHGYCTAYEFLFFSEIILLFLYLVCGFSLLLFLMVFIVKHPIKAGLITLFISIWYLFYGAIYDALDTHFKDSFFSAHIFLAPFFLIVSLLFGYFIIKRNNYYLLIRYLFTLLVILCVVDIGSLFLKIQHSNKSFVPNKLISKSDENIYLLLYDEYPGFRSLKDSFGFINPIDTFLLNTDFKIVTAKSNYNITHFSVASMLNMNYLQYVHDNETVDNNTFDSTLMNIKYNAVCTFLRNAGYTIENNSIFEIKNAPTHLVYNPFVNQHNRILTDKIFHNRIYKEINWNLFYILKNYRVDDLQDKFDYEKNIPHTITIKPHSKAFYYYHFNMPHEPLMCDSNGHVYHADTLFNETIILNKSLFISYLKYTNKHIKTLITKIIDSDKDAIIFLLGDHGYKYYYKNETTPCNYRFDNLMAIRTTQYGSQIPDSLSNVNLFRWLLNTQFTGSSPILSDSTYFLKIQP